MPLLRLVPLALLAVGVAFAGDPPKKVEPKIKPGKDTTVIDGPVAADGYYDYETALNDRLRGKTTPATSVANNGYELHIQKQPGTDGMCIHVNIGRDGKAPKDLRFTGGKRLPDGRICLTTDVTISARW